MIEFGYKTFVIPGILALAVGLWALIVGACREELLNVLERFNRLSRPVKAGLCAIVAMLAFYAGAKHGQPTNPPPDNASSPTNAVEESKSEVEVEQWNLSTCASGLEEEGNILCSPSTSCFAYSSPSPTTYASIANWTARGAYCDWERIDFRDGFQFPVGTNFIDGVTLFAYGELKSNLHCSTSTSDFDFSLPQAVSLEPGVSSVTHGLTPSNSYLFAWHNCCVERCATNRVDASIELFRNGAVATIVTPLSTNQPPITIYQPPTPPEGFVGHGQDEDWIRGNFGDEATNILAVGYAAWLDEWVGVNEPNERCQCAVTVSALPEDGSPCYLACGPYQVNVPEPGVYRFPLEVSTTYHVRTYPTAVPLEFEFDDGYRGNGTSFHVVDGEHPVLEPPRRLMLAAPPPPSSDYWKTIVPDLVVDPKHIPLDQVENTPLRVWCNLRDFTLATIESAAYICYHVVSRDEAALERAYEAALCYACVQSNNAYLRGEFWIDPAAVTNDPHSVTNRTDAWIFSGEPRHTEVRDDNRMIRYATAVSGGEASDVSWSLNLAEGQSVYVAVFMATSEPGGEPPYDDHVLWSVTSNGSGGLSGQTSVFAERERIAAANSITHHLYEIDYDPLLLSGGRFDPPDEDVLRLTIRVTASDAIDQLRETCVQVIVFPIDENGQVVGKPDWVSFE